MEKAEVEANVEIGEYGLAYLRLGKSPDFLRLPVEEWGVELYLLNNIFSLLYFVSEANGYANKTAIRIFQEDWVRGLKVKCFLNLCIVHDDSGFMNESVSLCDIFQILEEHSVKIVATADMLFNLIFGEARNL